MVLFLPALRRVFLLPYKYHNACTYCSKYGKHRYHWNASLIVEDVCVDITPHNKQLAITAPILNNTILSFFFIKSPRFIFSISIRHHSSLCVIHSIISFSDCSKYERFSFRYLPKVLYTNPINGIIRYNFFSLSLFGINPFK